MSESLSSSPALLLISNSTSFGRGYLDLMEEPVRSFLGDVKRVLFVPFALLAELLSW